MSRRFQEHPGIQNRLCQIAAGLTSDKRNGAKTGSCEALAAGSKAKDYERLAQILSIKGHSLQ